MGQDQKMADALSAKGWLKISCAAGVQQYRCWVDALQLWCNRPLPDRVDSPVKSMCNARLGQKTVLRWVASLGTSKVCAALNAIVQSTAKRRQLQTVQAKCHATLQTGGLGPEQVARVEQLQVRIRGCFVF